MHPEFHQPEREKSTRALCTLYSVLRKKQVDSELNKKIIINDRLLD